MAKLRLGLFPSRRETTQIFPLGHTQGTEPGTQMCSETRQPDKLTNRHGEQRPGPPVQATRDEAGS